MIFRASWLHPLIMLPMPGPEFRGEIWRYDRGPIWADVDAVSDDFADDGQRQDIGFLPVYHACPVFNRDDLNGHVIFLVTPTPCVGEGGQHSLSSVASGDRPGVTV